MNGYVVTPVRYLGRWSIGVIRSLGSAGYLAVGAVGALKNVEIWGGRLVPQMVAIGVASAPIALFIATFTGIVLALQASYTLTDAVPMYFVGAPDLRSNDSRQHRAVLAGAESSPRRSPGEPTQVCPSLDLLVRSSHR